MTAPIECVVEVGAKRTFAAAPAWPGWCRSAKTEDEALETLVAYGERYAAVLAPAWRRQAAATSTSGTCSTSSRMSPAIAWPTSRR